MVECRRLRCRDFLYLCGYVTEQAQNQLRALSVSADQDNYLSVIVDDCSNFGALLYAGKVWPLNLLMPEGAAKLGERDLRHRFVGRKKLFDQGEVLWV